MPLFSEQNRFMVDIKSIKVEVAYAAPHSQEIVELEVKEGITVEEAIVQSKIKDLYPEIDLEQNKVGIFGKLNKLDYVLKPGDRIEIYRPLIADPKEMRKQRAEKLKKKKEKS